VPTVKLSQENICKQVVAQERRTAYSTMRLLLPSKSTLVEVLMGMGRESQTGLIRILTQEWQRSAN